MLETVRTPRGVDAPLRGVWLLAARSVWLLVATLAAVLLIVGIVQVWHSHSYICAKPTAWRGCELLRSLGLGFLARDSLGLYTVSLVSLMCASWTLMGWLVFWRSPVSAASLLMSLGLVTGWATDVTGLHMGTAFYTSVSRHPELLPPGLVCLFVVQVAAQGSVVPMLLLLPDGRFGPRWAAPLALFWVLYTPVNVLYHDPFAWFAGSLVLELLEETLVLAMPLALVAAVRLKLRSASGPARTQLKTVTPSAVAFLVAYAAFALWLALIWASGGTDPTAVRYLTHFVQVGVLSAIGTWFGVAIGTAVLRYNLFRADLVVSRALLYGALSGALLLLYLVVVFGLGSALGVSGSPWFSLFAAALTVALFDPLRALLTRRVNRSLYGERGVPFRAFVGLSKQLQDDLVPQDYLPNLARRLSERFGLPYVKLVAHTGALEAEAQVGEPQGEAVRFPISSQGQVLGALEVAVPPGEVLAAEERTVLAAVAGQLGVRLRSLELSAELQAVRGRLSGTREAERRRLQRDLHDRLGPTLAAQSLAVSSARHLLRADAGRAERLLEKLEDELWGTLEGVRRLAHNLTPPDLEVLGLEGALRLRAEALAGERLKLELVFPDTLPPAPAAESAAYHIVSEAVANVVRHAGARTCRVELRADGGWLELSVTDDGRGFVGEGRGLGLVSMRERAEEIGGRFAVTAAPDTPGVRVWASLPLAAAPSAASPQVAVASARESADGLPLSAPLEG